MRGVSFEHKVGTGCTDAKFHRHCIGRWRGSVSLGFDAEPYTPQTRHRALEQHPSLAEAIIAGEPVAAARIAAEHFSLTEEMLRELHARINIRSEGEPDGRSDS